MLTAAQRIVLFSSGRPTLDLDFLSGALDQRITFIRASGATNFDAAGILRSAANDVPRFDYNPTTLAVRGLLIEEQRTNSIRNPRAEGAIAGTPGTFPTFWGFDSVPGWMTRTVVGAGTQNGLPYLDVRISGTPSSSNQWTFGGEAYTGVIVASNGQTYTGSFYISIVAGGMTNLTSTFDVTFRDAGGSALTSTSIAVVPTSTPTRNFVTCLGANAAIAFVGSLIRFIYTNGQPIDLTFRIGAPLLELGRSASSVILPPAAAPAAATRAADTASLPLGPWYNPMASTFVAEVTADGSYANSPVLVQDNGGARKILLFSTGGAGRTESAGGNLNTANTVAVGAPVKIAVAFDGVTRRLCMNGGAVASDANPPAAITIAIDLAVSAASLNGRYKRLLYFPRAMADAELQRVTT